MTHPHSSCGHMRPETGAGSLCGKKLFFSLQMFKSAKFHIDMFIFHIKFCYLHSQLLALNLLRVEIKAFTGQFLNRPCHRTGLFLRNISCLVIEICGCKNRAAVTGLARQPDVNTSKLFLQRRKRQWGVSHSGWPSSCEINEIRKMEWSYKGFACKTRLAILCSLVIWASIWHVVVCTDQQGTLHLLPR